MATADVRQAGGARPRGDKQSRDDHPAACPPQGMAEVASLLKKTGWSTRHAFARVCMCACTPLSVIMTALEESDPTLENV